VSLVISGLIVVAMLLNAFGLLGGIQLQTWTEQVEAMRASLALQGVRARTLISAVSATASSSGSATQVQVTVANDGAEPVHPPSEMDVIVLYTAVNRSTVLTRLAYTSGPVGNNQWTLSGLSPDRGNPGIWDPGEQATLYLKLVPPARQGTTGLVVISTPNGVTDQVHFTP